ncbi:hypothetical protein MPTK1_1g20920 [Marchantia polymorpha subsp. ruderalis]|uniref:Uncharacterized protein n=2 Tax=Marchantia polymorpha TaxID=3197 RepID=A0AAF6ASG4_MARPO|nr:hypothetical protein MARPO_0001s0427 [Marchantia polymorpha]PTQ50470.1 hypothetical protein MARPO_0001s0427 [Marchantia polymorpha]BBM99383.1 hypothetical protein Mp_1g20920 [Marchantia polymorpha subsp. ruderalis]BBM99384.1 hypothetical protein Mp_1g20920 [Marchantia polymorpha subsp. ruderalis]|eukprot:PTQ50469.1 hypothetical protein MARPO_0001s0427 [Marchantia polymorpha]
MAESKRSWPWKKKSQEKVASAPDSTESSPRPSPHSSKFFDEQEVSGRGSREVGKIIVGQKYEFDRDVSKVVSDHNRSSSDVLTQWQQSEAKLKNLSDKLSVAITEITAKDSLVKQHAKVAEEAVSGWEKAEAEAAALKQQLDLTIQHKLATEDRVSHLDGALKECMKQLRHVREEQEQRIHETMVKKTREYDKLRQEMEAKLADFGQHLQEARAEALESRGEARAMSNVLQEKTKALSEVGEAKARAEAEVKILQVRLESLEKENSNLKYELHVQNKELEIRNEEREYERKATDIASKQHLENVKKIAKLEAECQRLRILVRKKLPGPAALAQMKQEVDALGGSKEYDGKRRRSLGRSTTSRDSDSALESIHDSYQESSNREADALADRMGAMDDELKLLKEALAKRDVELQASRLMCAKTASKLSHVEEQLEAARSGVKGTSAPRLISHQREGSRNSGFMIKDGSDSNSVDAWEAASALIAELDQFKKGTDKQQLGPGKLDLMDDFAEMERLAMASETSDSEKKADGSSGQDNAEYLQKLAQKERELDAANRLCQELSHKLAQAEEHLATLQSRNAANESAIIGLQEKLDKLGESHHTDEGAKINKALEDLVEAQSISLRNGAANESVLYDEEGSHNGGRMSNGGKISMASRSSSEVGYEANEDLASVLSDAESKASTMGSDLPAIVRRVVRAVEAMAQATGSEHEVSGKSRAHSNSSSFDRSGHDQILPFIHWKNRELDGNMQGLIVMSNKLLLGKADMVDFLAELTAVLNLLVNVCTRNVDQLVERIESQADGMSSREKEEELRRVRSEKAALESHMRAEMSRLSGLEAELESTKLEKAEVQRCLDVANERLEATSSQLREAEKLASEVHGSHEHIEIELHDLATAKAELDREVTVLHKKVAHLEGELQAERRRYQEVVAKYHDYQQQLHSNGGGSDSSAGSITRDGDWGANNMRHQSVDESELRLRKEREISSAAEKLAECQRSILDLGKQLKALTSPRDSCDASYESDTASSIDRATLNGEHRAAQSQPEETLSENNMVSDMHERTPSGRSREDSSTPWSTPRANSVTGSPFVDRRRSPSPSPPQHSHSSSSSRAATPNGHHYPGASYTGRATTGEFKQGNGYHHSGSMGSATPNYQYGGALGTPAASEFSLLGSLSVPASPARSPASGLPFRPRGTSPMRSDFSHSSSSGNGTKEGGDSESSTTSFSRFYARTKSSGRLD